MGYNIPKWTFQIPHWKYIVQLGIENLFSVYDLPDSEIPNPQLGILFPTGDSISLIGDDMPNRGYYLLVVYYVIQIHLNL